jgi:hypothetical protein
MTACDDCLRRSALIAALAGRFQVEFKRRTAPGRVLALADAELLELAGASDAQLWLALRRLPPEAAEVVAAGDGAAAEAAQRWLDDVRHRALDIGGDDLVAAGLSGPAVGRALEAATVAMLDGAAGDREAQLAAALAAVAPSG